MELKTSKKKLKASLFLFIISLIALAVVVGMFVLDHEVTKGFIAFVMPVGVVAYLILLSASMLLNISYRNSCIYPGASSTALYVFQWIFYAPFIIVGVIILVVGMFCGAKVPVFGSKKEKVIKVKDEKGYEYKLTPTYADTFDGSEEYEDQNGNLWETWDGGQTFKISKRITPFYIYDSVGNEIELRPFYRGSQRYLDEHGDEWWTLDGGQTFERVPKK